MTSYATLEDIYALFRQLNGDEVTRAAALLPVISDELRYRAMLVHMDLDEIIKATKVQAND